MTARITLNGEPCELADPALESLLRAQAIEPDARGVAVAVNGAIVPRREWATRRLEAGDAVEIVKLFAGG